MFRASMCSSSGGKKIVCLQYLVTELYDQTNRPETLEVEPEEEVDTDEKGPYILQGEVEKNYQGNEEQKGYRR